MGDRIKSLTNIEKVLLVNQFEILRQITPGGNEHYNDLIEIIRNGYSIFYSMIDSEITEEEMSVEESRFVLDILNFYRAIEFYKRDNPNDSNKIIEHQYAQFKGFDGNEKEECRYMGFVNFLFETQNKFKELHYCDSNSHCPMADTYRKIIAALNKMNVKFPKTKEEILSVLNAATQGDL